MERQSFTMCIKISGRFYFRTFKCTNYHNIIPTMEPHPGPSSKDPRSRLTCTITFFSSMKVAATKSSLMIEKDLHLQQSDTGSFDVVFDDPPYCAQQPRIIRQSVHIIVVILFHQAQLIPPSPTSPDFSFLSCMRHKY